MKRRIIISEAEIDASDTACDSCEWLSEHDGAKCVAFNWPLHRNKSDGVALRCQPCLDAEVRDE